MKKYYVHIGKEQQGPFDLAEMAGVRLLKDTPVWYEGITDWTTAGEVDELKSLLVSSAPPPYIPKTHSLQETEPVKRKTYWGWVVFLFVLLFGFFAGSIFLNKNIHSGTGTEKGEVSKEETYRQKIRTVGEVEKAEPAKFLIADGTFKKNLWGGKFKLNCEIKNTATVATYKDATLKVTYYSKTNAVLGSKEYTVYESFPPKSGKTVPLKIESIKNAETIEWKVVKAVAF